MTTSTVYVRVAWAAAIVATLAACPPKRVDNKTRLPANQAVVLLFKTLTYDNNIAKARKQLRVGVVYASDNNDSTRIAKQTLAAIKNVSHIRVRGLKIEPVLVPALDVAGLTSGVDTNKVNMIFLAPGIDAVLGGLCQLANKRRILVVSGDQAHSKVCSTLTVVRRGRKPKVLLNLKAAGAQGASFAEPLLRVAELVN